ncbi:MAG: hypothetical protein ACE5HR_00360 [bacterium]
MKWLGCMIFCLVFVLCVPCYAVKSIWRGKVGEEKARLVVDESSSESSGRFRVRYAENVIRGYMYNYCPENSFVFVGNGKFNRTSKVFIHGVQDGNTLTGRFIILGECPKKRFKFRWIKTVDSEF